MVIVADIEPITPSPILEFMSEFLFRFDRTPMIHPEYFQGVVAVMSAAFVQDRT